MTERRFGERVSGPWRRLLTLAVVAAVAGGLIALATGTLGVLAGDTRPPTGGPSSEATPILQATPNPTATGLPAPPTTTSWRGRARSRCRCRTATRSR